MRRNPVSDPIERRRVFAPAYSNVYDSVYRKKDYRSEAFRVHRAIRAFSPGARMLTELGCGTGGHARFLAQWYRMRCFERSGSMLALARLKVKGLPVRFVRADIAHQTSFGRDQDAVVSLFHVLNYITAPQLRGVVRAVRRTLRPGGVFLFDSWNAAAVLRHPPSVRRRRFRVGALQFVREVTPRLDWASSTCEVGVTVRRPGRHRGRRLASEVHSIRYYLPTEIRDILHSEGFRVRRVSNDFGRPLGMDDWSMQVVATKAT